MLSCPKCNTEIKVEVLSDILVEVSCSCQKPRHYRNQGNYDEIRQRYRDISITGIQKRIKEKPTVKSSELNEKLKKTFPEKEFSESTIYKYLPSKFKPRPIQIQLWKEIQSKIKSGCKNIVLCAPTGVGKSVLAACLAKQLERSFIVTGTKILQDQYVKDFPQFVPVKGKSNFACFKIMENEKIPLHNIDLALKKGLTCEKGICEDCSFRPTIQDFVTGEHKKNACLYYNQKYLGLSSDHSVWNYASYFQIIEQSDKYPDYLDRTVAIFDEAHKIEDEVINFLEIIIKRAWLNECKINEKDHDLTDIEEILKLLQKLLESYSDQIKVKKEQNPSNADYEVIKKLEEKHEKISIGIKNISEKKTNFIPNDVKRDSNGKFIEVSIKPLDIRYYIKKYFQNKYQIFMSATIDKKTFCENLGFSEDVIGFIDTAKSPFKKEHRKICFEKTVNLKFKAPESDWHLAIEKIDQLLTDHKNKRGLILTTSKKNCILIKEKISLLNQKRVTIYHSGKKTMKEVLQEHKMEKDSVLLSSSLWEGIDLKGDSSEFQIIVNTPYPMQDKRAEEMKKRYPRWFWNWYNSKTMVKLLQGCGRSIRDEDDIAITHIIDSRALPLLEKVHSRVPHSYFDVLGWDSRTTNGVS